MAGKGQSYTAPVAAGLTIQTSVYGGAVPIVYGKTRVQGNLIWYGDFTPIANTQNTGSGKGGGGSSSTTYTYTVSFALGLCEGPIAGIGACWIGKNQSFNATAPVSAGTNETVSSEPHTVPSYGPLQVTVGNAAQFAADAGVSAAYYNPDGSATSTALVAGTDYTVSAGTYTFIAKWAGCSVAISYQFTSSVSQAAIFTLFDGTYPQTPWSYLTANHAGQDLAYGGVAYVAAAGYGLGSDSSIPNHNFEVQGALAQAAFNYAGANPADIVNDLLTNSHYGAQFPSANIGPLTAYWNYCQSGGIFLSPCYDSQNGLNQMLQDLMQLTNTGVYFSEGMLKIVPYGDAAQSGFGATYTPNLTPVANFTDDDFQAGTDDPVLVMRNAIPTTYNTTVDAYNQVQLEYLNRTNQYNPEPCAAQDQVSVDTYGLIPMPPITAHQITDPTVANVCANLILQRAVNVRAQYQFQLGWDYAYLEPTDIVTISDAYLGLSYWPVRVISVEEDGDGLLKIIAEDAPPGAASFVRRPPNSGTGYSVDYNASPKQVGDVFIFEAPSEFTTTGLAVWVGATGSAGDILWGGANVWLSLDNITYTQVGVIEGPSRIGHLSAGVTDVSSAATIPVALDGLGGTLTSVSASDLANLSTLTYIGGANPEYIAYQTATLTGANAYNLTGLIRGAYGTAGALHSSADPLIRVDSSISKGDSLDLSKIGQTVYFKVQSFNSWGGGTLPLSSCAVYSHTITGTMAKLPPKPPTSLQVSIETGGVRIRWVVSTSATVATYELRVGATWATAALIGQSLTSNYLWAMQTAGTYTIWIAAVDKFGNYSTPVSVVENIVAPGPVQSPATSIVDNNVLFTWVAPLVGSQPIAHYEIRKGLTYSGSGLIGLNGPSTFFTYFESAAGNYTYWITPIDVAGNYGTSVSITAAVQQPPDYVLRADYFSNFVGTPILTMYGGQEGSNVTVSASNVVTCTGTTNGMAKAAAAFPRGGKAYWEVVCEQVTASFRVGIAQAGTALTQLGLDATSYGYDNSGAIYYNGSAVQTGLATLAAGSIVGVQLDQVANTLTFFVNGVQQGTAVSIAAPAIGATCSFATNQMTQVTAPTSGAFAVGQAVVAPGVPPGTTITAGGSSPFTLSAAVGTIATENVSAYLPWFPAVSMLTTGDALQVNFGTTNFQRATPGGGVNGATNTLLDGGTLLAPVNTGTTVATHFTGNSWSSPQDQINAGYPLYLEPSLTTASYEELIDYGAVLPATTITVTPTTSPVAGTVTVTPTIYTSLDGVTWTNNGAGLTAVLVQSFRYVRVHLDFAATGGTNLVRLTSLETKLSVKQRRDAGTAVCNSTDTQSAGPHSGSAGTWVPFNYPFISANFPLIQITSGQSAGNPYTAIIDFTGPTNPTGFGVLIYDKNGVRQSANISWSDTGY